MLSFYHGVPVSRTYYLGLQGQGIEGTSCTYSVLYNSQRIFAFPCSLVLNDRGADDDDGNWRVQNLISRRSLLVALGCAAQWLPSTGTTIPSVRRTISMVLLHPDLSWVSACTDGVLSGHVYLLLQLQVC